MENHLIDIPHQYLELVCANVVLRQDGLKGKNKMKTIIHVNQHIIKSNNKLKKNFKPVLTVKTYKSTKYASKVKILGESIVIYSPKKPLNCGAKCWLETYGEILIVKE